MTANYHKILVPMDGSKESEAALSRAIELKLCQMKHAKA